MRQEGPIEKALQAKLQINHNTKTKKKKGKKKNANSNEVGANDNNSSSGNNNNKNYPSCQHYGKKGHLPFKWWRRPNLRCNNCNHIRHHEKIC